LTTLLKCNEKTHPVIILGILVGLLVCVMDFLIISSLELFDVVPFILFSISTLFLLECVYKYFKK
jgi:hypothetical protein